MQSNSLPVRVLAAGLPLLAIALVASAAGYFSKEAETRPVPPLPPAEERATGVLGAVQSFTGNQLTVVAQDGTTTTFDLASGVPIERLAPITRDALQAGDWVNGGAVPHAQTVLALVGLVLVEEPTVSTR